MREREAVPLRASRCRGTAGALVLAFALALGHAHVSPAQDTTASSDTDLASARARLATYRLTVPVQGVRREALRDSFREARGGSAHEALDIPAPRGTPVIAAGDGRIVKLFHSRAGGLTVYQFDPRQEFAYYYAHLDRYAEDLHEGMEVTQGRLLGNVGTTGNAPPDAPHLHFAIFRLGPGRQWWKGTPLDPFGLLNDPVR